MLAAGAIPCVGGLIMARTGRLATLAAAIVFLGGCAGASGTPAASPP